ncbi:MAG: SCO family protein [Armatimonadota bacterium]|nr:SCO family protein [Armatimonadota bacterium]MDR7455041.1 SCO family protein [Armatimonadota bacterium]MDR7455737.1 SCO family protein [Armatimonadota bacterium]MDR7497567.1 SCO family protein [Armatimonadota bacterium]
MHGIRTVAAVGLALAGGACLRAAPPAFHGLPVREPFPVAITLLDHHRRPFSLDALRGTVVLLAFGYTLCPDVCPTTLVTLRQARALLGADATKVVVLFVTTDPDRDTPERLQWYVSIFHPDFIGLTGAPGALARLYRAFNVYPVPYAAAGSGEDARIGHATAIYLIDRRGTIRFSYPWGVLAADLAADARAVLAER